MPWDYHIAADAWADLHRLDVELQEHVLDELDELCEVADDLQLVGRSARTIRPVVNGVMTPLKLFLVANPQHGLITLLGVRS